MGNVLNKPLWQDQTPLAYVDDRPDPKVLSGEMLKFVRHYKVLGTAQEKPEASDEVDVADDLGLRADLGPISFSLFFPHFGI